MRVPHARVRVWEPDAALRRYVDCTFLVSSMEDAARDVARAETTVQVRCTWGVLWRTVTPTEHSPAAGSIHASWTSRVPKVGPLRRTSAQETLRVVCHDAAVRGGVCPLVHSKYEWIGRYCGRVPLLRRAFMRLRKAVHDTNETMDMCEFQQ